MQLDALALLVPIWCSCDPILCGEPGEVMGPVHRSLVMFESFLRAKAFSHRPMAQKAVMALGKQCVSLSTLRQLG